MRPPLQPMFGGPGGLVTRWDVCRQGIFPQTPFSGRLPSSKIVFRMTPKIKSRGPYSLRNSAVDFPDMMYEVHSCESPRFLLQLGSVWNTNHQRRERGDWLLFLHPNRWRSEKNNAGGFQQNATMGESFLKKSAIPQITVRYIRALLWGSMTISHEGRHSRLGPDLTHF